MALEILKITELVLGCSVVEQMKCPRKWERPQILMVRSEGLEPPTPWFEA